MTDLYDWAMEENDEHWKAQSWAATPPRWALTPPDDDVDVESYYLDLDDERDDDFEDVEEEPWGHDFDYVDPYGDTF